MLDKSYSLGWKTAAICLLLCLAGVFTYLILAEPDPLYPESSAGPEVKVEQYVKDLSHPWDVTFSPSGALLWSERETGEVWAKTSPDASPVQVLSKPPDFWASGETGMMGIAVDDEALYTCSGWLQDGVPEVRVNRWNLSPDLTATFDRTIVAGLPATSGRHGGCALLVGVFPGSSKLSLFVGTGDAADERNPQDVTRGGGKTLRVSPIDGSPVKGNPFPDEDNFGPLVYSYGHRNVQGLAYSESLGLYSGEQGSDNNDEVNRLSSPGLNFGWDPGRGYDESVPMTDQSLPGSQTDPVWRSGDSTIATSGIEFLPTSGWGEWSGGLVLGNLKDQSLRVLKLNSDGSLAQTFNPPSLQGKYGRLRNIAIGPDGAMYVTTDNGEDNDYILRISVAKP